MNNAFLFLAAEQNPVVLGWTSGLACIGRLAILGQDITDAKVILTCDIFSLKS